MALALPDAAEPRAEVIRGELTETLPSGAALPDAAEPQVGLI